MVNVEYIAQNVAEYIFVRLSKHVDLDLAYQRRIMEKAVTRACDLCRVCKGVTLKGGRCSRQVAGDADYCFQHRGATMASNNPRHRSSAEKESSGSEEKSSEAETEEDSDEESSGSDEEETEVDDSASEEESEGESSGESSDEEVPPPKKAKKAKKYRTTVEDCPEEAEEEPSPAHPPERREAIPLVQEFEDEKDRFACAFLGAVVETVDNLKGGGAALDGDDIAHLLRLKYNTKCVIKDIQEAGVINHRAVDKITASLREERYGMIDLEELMELTEYNLGTD